MPVLLLLLYCLQWAAGMACGPSYFGIFALAPAVYLLPVAFSTWMFLPLILAWPMAFNTSSA